MLARRSRCGDCHLATLKTVKQRLLVLASIVMFASAVPAICRAQTCTQAPCFQWLDGGSGATAGVAGDRISQCHIRWRTAPLVDRISVSITETGYVERQNVSIEYFAALPSSASAHWRPRVWQGSANQWQIIVKLTFSPQLTMVGSWAGWKSEWWPERRAILSTQKIRTRAGLLIARSLDSAAQHAMAARARTT
jgi:hypothetical protein